jgi:C-terminal processing protease CtpA/Prc
MFPGQVGIDIAHDIDKAVAELGVIDKLIVDLRGNSGGGLGMIRLMSYFTPGRVPIGYSLTRRRAERGYRREELSRFKRIPSKKIALLWLLMRYGFVDQSITLVTEGMGPKTFHGRMVLLINEHSASASEVIAAFAAENKFARLVGSPTVGRLLSGDSFRVGSGFILVVPTAAYITWQGTLIEGKGVRPDILIDWSPERARAGGDNQLERAIEVVKGL